MKSENTSTLASKLGTRILALTLLVASPLAAQAASGIRFQKPNLHGQSENEGLRFRSSSAAEQPRTEQELTADDQPLTARVEPAPAKRLSTAKRPAPAYVTQAEAAQPEAAQPARRETRRPELPARSYRDNQVEQVSYRSARTASRQDRFVRPVRHLQQSCDTCLGGCDCDPGCGLAEPGCGIGEPGCGAVDAGCGCAEPTCGLYESGCGCADPGCGLVDAGCGCAEPACGVCDGGYCDGGCDPGCGLADPSCGCDGVGCGSCVGNDYDCFRICIPRFRELIVWGGVHGFKGPRDSPAFGGAGDGNFGFQEGVNISGRTPIVGLLFPEINYQLGYQAVQSRLSGSSAPDAGDRAQQFFTGGFFRRVESGLQFGVVFDLMRDDLITEVDFHQLRYEISLKSPRGREFGFWGTSATNMAAVGGIDYEAVSQYALFYRWHFCKGGEGRIWGGGTNDGEGLVGTDFQLPLNDRWSLQSGFNYLISDAAAGAEGAREESWNVGMNLVWHYGKTARKGGNSPFRPLFRVADNGWMFVDQTP